MNNLLLVYIGAGKGFIFQYANRIITVLEK